MKVENKLDVSQAVLSVNTISPFKLSFMLKNPEIV